MNCPFCGHGDTKVVDSRDTNDRKAIRRRRECEKCEARFSTYEEIEILRLTVLKRDGTRQEYNPDKIKQGLQRAFEKRPGREEKCEKLFSEIEYAIHSRDSKEIESRDIGKIILFKLKEVDEVAYMRFASVYKSFGSMNSFIKELEKLKNK